MARPRRLVRQAAESRRSLLEALATAASSTPSSATTEGSLTPSVVRLAARRAGDPGRHARLRGDARADPGQLATDATQNDARRGPPEIVAPPAARASRWRSSTASLAASWSLRPRNVWAIRRRDGLWLAIAIAVRRAIQQGRRVAATTFRRDRGWPLGHRCPARRARRTPPLPRGRRHRAQIARPRREAPRHRSRRARPRRRARASPKSRRFQRSLRAPDGYLPSSAVLPLAKR